MMPLFGSLKKTVKHINNEMSELRNVQPVFLFKTEIDDPAPNIPGFESKEMEIKFSEMKSLLKNIRVSTSKFEANFKSKQDITKRYYHDFEDFYLELNSKCVVVENRLVQFGYCPPKTDIPCENGSEKVPKTPVENENGQQDTNDATPKLIRLKISSKLSDSPTDISLNKGNEDKTPVLCLDIGDQVTTKPKQINSESRAGYIEVSKKLVFNLE